MKGIVIDGSLRDQSRTATMATVVQDLLSRQIPTQLVTARSHNLPALTERATAALSSEHAALAHATLVVLVSPILNAGASGLLKLYLDAMPRKGLDGKVVGLVATAGSPYHSLAMWHSLAPILDSMGASHVARGVTFTAEETPLPYSLSASNCERLERSLHQLVHMAATQNSLHALRGGEYR